MAAPPPPPPYSPYPPYTPQPGMQPGPYPGQGPPVITYMPAPAGAEKEPIKLIVLIAVLALAIPIVLAAVLYVMVAGLGGPGGPGNMQPPTMVLQGGGSWASDSTTATYTFTVATVTPANAIVDPVLLQYILSNSAQTTLYSGAANQNTTSSGFTINVVYGDATAPGRVSSGDRIHLTVSPVQNNPLVGGRMQVNFDSAMIGTGHM